MNSEKGAKGERRDRVISWLFSLKNNNRKKEKEENKDKKRKTEDNLTYVNENNNIKEEVPSISIKSSEKEKETTIDTEKQVIDQSKNDNDKSFSISEVTEIKTEEHEIIPEVKIIPLEDKDEKEDSNELELSIIDAVEKIIKEDIYELEKIEYELEVLKEKEDKEENVEEVQKLKEELQELIKKLEQIKEKYEYLPYDSNLSLLIDDEYIYSLVSEYKDTMKDEKIVESINSDIRKIEEYISIIDKIINIEKEEENLDKLIDEKMDDLDIRDLEFEKMKEDYTDIEAIDKYIQDFSYDQEKIINELNRKIQDSISIQTKIEKEINLVPQFNKLIEAALLIAASKKLPPTLGGNLMKANLMVNAIFIASNFIKTEEKEKKITIVKYSDYSKDIIYSINATSEATTNINKALINIKDMQELFKKECYGANIPEYDEFMKNMINLEKELREKRSIINKYNKDFNYMLIDHNVKIKRLEEMKN